MRTRSVDGWEECFFNKLLPLGLKGLWSLTWKAAFLNGALLELVWLSHLKDIDFKCETGKL